MQNGARLRVSVDALTLLLELQGLSPSDVGLAWMLALRAAASPNGISHDPARLRKMCGVTGANGWETRWGRIEHLFRKADGRLYPNPRIFSVIDGEDPSPAPAAPPVPVPAPEPEGPTLRERVLAELGADPVSGILPTGRRIGGPKDAAEIQKWVAAGVDDEQVIAVVRDILQRRKDRGELGPVGSFAYFTGAILEAAKKPKLTPSGEAKVRLKEPTPEEWQEVDIRQKCERDYKARGFGTDVWDEPVILRDEHLDQLFREGGHRAFKWRRDVSQYPGPTSQFTWDDDIQGAEVVYYAATGEPIPIDANGDLIDPRR